MAGFPAPPFNVFFQIEAVAEDPEHVTKRELKLMLQTLLEDRFKARVHLETREVDGYALTIAKSGIKFKETSGDAKAAVTTPTPQPTDRSSGTPPPCLYDAAPGVPRTVPSFTPRIFVRGKCGMTAVTTFLLKLLTLNSVTPIADKTGLMGIYDIDFLLEEVLLPTPTGGGTRGEGSQQARQFYTPVPKALEEQLGIHMERVKVPGEFVVVDHLEQPTED